MDNLPITVIIPTWRRTAILLKTLNAVAACDPLPAEIVIHIDAHDDETEAALAASPLPVRILHSETTMGPGGGRNRLMQEAAHNIMVSLDDDSYPIDKDFFQQVMQCADDHPEFAVFALPALLLGETPSTDPQPIRETSAFEGCAAILRRDALLSVAGYLPLRYAYGMEEADIALQLLDAGFSLARVDHPQVQHDTTPNHHSEPAVDRAWLINTALLTALRYPAPHLFLLPIKILRRMIFSMKQGRVRTVFSGLTAIPGTLWHYRHMRAPIKRRTIRRYIALNRTSTR